MTDRGWKREFEDPIPLSRGCELVTPHDAGKYITKLPKAEHDAPEWRAAIDRDAEGCRARWADDAGADRNDAGAAPASPTGAYRFVT